jgi:hypothetical protein
MDDEEEEEDDDDDDGGDGQMQHFQFEGFFLSTDNEEDDAAVSNLGFFGLWTRKKMMQHFQI